MRSRCLFVVFGLALSACGGRAADVRPSIEITRVPPADKGGPDTLDVIEGRVTGARPGQRVVLFAKGRVWWVQPDAKEPFTEIQKDSRWKSSTHLGTEYAALLVEPDYRPPTFHRRSSAGRCGHRGRDRRARRPHEEGLPSHDRVQRLRVARPRRFQRPGRAERVRSRQRVDGRGGSDAPPHRGTGAGLDVCGGQPHPAPRVRVRTGSSCATCRSWNRRRCSACSPGTAPPPTRTTARWTSRSAGGAIPPPRTRNS